MKGMTPIVKYVTSLIAALAALYGLYVMVSGHVSPGGGFAGGLVLLAVVVLLVLAFGADAPRGRAVPRQCRLFSGLGALGFVLVAAGGFAKGGWFVNFLPKYGEGLFAAGAILLSDFFVGLMVGSGLAGLFLVLADSRGPKDQEDRDAL